MKKYFHQQYKVVRKTNYFENIFNLKPIYQVKQSLHCNALCNKDTAFMKSQGIFYKILRILWS